MASAAYPGKNSGPSDRQLAMRNVDPIHIRESRVGSFTEAANAHHMSDSAFASQVLSNKEDYSSKMVKKAVFDKNIAK